MTRSAHLVLLFLVHVSAFVVPRRPPSLRPLPALRETLKNTSCAHHSSRLFLVSSTASSNPSPATSNKKDTRKKRLATGMAFLTGWADIVLFLKYETFATMMTGNYMWMAKALLEQNFKRVFYYASVIAAYLFGIATFRRCDLNLRKESMHVCSVAVALLFCVSDVIYILSGGSKWIPVLLLATAFGIINSIGSEVAGTMTFVVTGHMTKLTHCIVDRMSRTRGHQKLDWTAVLQNSAVMVGFLLGVLWACFLQKWSSRNVFSVIGVLYGILFYWLDMESFGGAWWLRKDGIMCELDDDGESCEEEDIRVSENI